MPGSFNIRLHMKYHTRSAKRMRKSIKCSGYQVRGQPFLKSPGFPNQYKKWAHRLKMAHRHALAAALCCLLVRGQFNSQSPFDRVLTPGLAGIGGLKAEAMDSGTVTRIRAQIQDGSKGR